VTAVDGAGVGAGLGRSGEGRGVVEADRGRTVVAVELRRPSALDVGLEGDGERCAGRGLGGATGGLTLLDDGGIAVALGLSGTGQSDEEQRPETDQERERT